MAKYDTCVAKYDTSVAKYDTSCKFQRDYYYTSDYDDLVV